MITCDSLQNSLVDRCPRPAKQRPSSKTPVYAGPKDQQLVLFFLNSHCPKIIQNTFQSSKQFSDLNSHGSHV